MMPGFIDRPPARTCRWCFLRRLAPCTTTRLSSGRVRRTSPRIPLSRPLMTSTVSPFLIFTSFPPLRRLQDFRRQRNNLGEPSLAQLARHGPKDTRPLRVDPIGVQDDGGVVVETNVGAVLAAILLGDAHDHRLNDLALVDGAVGPRRLDGGHDHIADAP